jgi:hypothetical protein
LYIPTRSFPTLVPNASPADRTAFSFARWADAGAANRPRHSAPVLAERKRRPAAIAKLLLGRVDQRTEARAEVTYAATNALLFSTNVLPGAVKEPRRP